MRPGADSPLIGIVDACSVSDRNEIRRILSSPDVLDGLCPGVSASVDELTDDWCKPRFGGDVMAVARAGDGRVLGSICLESDELSYFVRSEHWGHGYGTLMVRWVVRNVLASRSNECIHACTSRGNGISIRILENAGFRFSGLSTAHLGRHAMLTFRLSVRVERQSGDRVTLPGTPSPLGSASA